MISKMIILMSIITISAYGNESEEEEQLGVSSQSFHRDDIPSSNKYKSDHDYHKIPSSEKPQLEHNVYRQHKASPVRLSQIQYAPLIYEVKPNEYPEQKKEQNEIKQQDSESVPELETENDDTTDLEETKNTDHLEPRAIAPSRILNIKKQNSNTFKQGNNDEVAPILENENNFVTHQETYQKPQVKPQKFVYYQKQNQHFIEEIPKVKKLKEQPIPENYNILKFMEFNGPARKKLLPQPNAYALHEELAMEMPTQTYHNPRLHLNIARIYSISNPTQEPSFPHILVPQYAHPQTSNIGKPPALTQALSVPSMVDPWKTILYPVRKSHLSNSVY